MTDLTAEEIIRFLELEPLEFEGGYFRQTWKSEAGTAIYYLVTPESWSAFHLLDIPEIWHFYAGDPVRQLQLHKSGGAEVLVCGNNLHKGEKPQIICPGGSWQSTRLAEGGRWALLGTTMAPPFSRDGYRGCAPEKLLGIYPGYSELIKEFI